MENIQELLKAIHFPIDKIKDGKIENVSEVASEYLQSRNSFAETQLGSKKKEIEDAAIKAYQLKEMKSNNKTFNLGYTNSDFDNFKSIDDYYKDAESRFKKLIGEASKLTNEEYKNTLEKWQNAATEKGNALEKALEEKAAFEAAKEQEKNDAIRTFKAQIAYTNKMNGDKTIPDVPHKSWAIENILKEVESNYIIGEDLSLKGKDGSPAIHPGAEKTVSHLDEILPFYKEKAGLVKVSNAGETIDKTFTTAGGQSVGGQFSEKAMQAIKDMKESRHNAPV